MDHVANMELDARDPLYEVKKTTLQGLTDMSNGVSSTRNKMYNLILYVLAILITIPLSIAIEHRSWFWIFFIAVLLIAFLDYNLWRMKKEKDNYARVAKQLLAQAKRFGMNHPLFEKFNSK